MTTKEAYKELESAHFLKDSDLVQPSTPLEIADGLKHRQFISNDNFLLYAEAFNVTDGDYNSKDTMIHVDLIVLQEELMTFHKDIIALAKELLIPIYKSIDNILEED